MCSSTVLLRYHLFPFLVILMVRSLWPTKYKLHSCCLSAVEFFSLFFFLPRSSYFASFNDVSFDKSSWFMIMKSLQCARLNCRCRSIRYSMPIEGSCKSGEFFCTEIVSAFDVAYYIKILVNFLNIRQRAVIIWWQSDAVTLRYLIFTSFASCALSSYFYLSLSLIFLDATLSTLLINILRVVRWSYKKCLFVNGNSVHLVAATTGENAFACSNVK